MAALLALALVLAMLPPNSLSSKAKAAEWIGIRLRRPIAARRGDGLLRRLPVAAPLRGGDGDHDDDEYGDGACLACNDAPLPCSRLRLSSAALNRFFADRSSPLHRSKSCRSACAAAEWDGR